MSSDLPPSLLSLQVRAPDLFEEVADDVRRLLRATDAVAWAQDRLAPLVRCAGPAEVLGLLVREARQLTEAPFAWAVTWSGDLERGRASFRAFAGDGVELPAPGEISNTVIARAAREGRAVWTDDAASDARFAASESLRALTTRSVGCIPLGRRGVLYLQDPDHPGRFVLDARYRLTALCRLAAPFLEPRSASVARRAIEPVEGLVGESPAMGELYDGIRAFAAMPWPVLVLGESGTGKELVARALHRLSPRAAEPFVAVNCGAIPDELAESTLFGHERGAFTGADRRHEGLVARTGRGTLFLDEVGELAPRLQVKLLRLLQERTFEPVGGAREQRFEGRIVAATLRDLESAETRGSFREDLYYRLAACVLRTPPLRDRRSDVPDLARHLLAKAAEEVPGGRRVRITDAALDELSSRGWPGNVRELENVLRQGLARSMAARADAVGPEHLGVAPATAQPEEDVAPPTDLLAATEAFQRKMVEAALRAEDGHRTRAAERLGVSRQWLHRLLTRWE
ncbi:MAG: sigma-54-dependent Fis family transcriptional regulator [Alphaproteobacteria bacterium]|nr:sigma-54-dependent Fis family transcriptional regulator [Alphaproteobacteria bacterium]